MAHICPLDVKKSARYTNHCKNRLHVQSSRAANKCKAEFTAFMGMRRNVKRQEEFTVS